MVKDNNICTRKANIEAVLTKVIRCRWAGVNALVPHRKKDKRGELLWWTKLGEKVGGDRGGCLLQTRKGIFAQQCTQTHDNWWETPSTDDV